MTRADFRSEEDWEAWLVEWGASLAEDDEKPFAGWCLPTVTEGRDPESCMGRGRAWRPKWGVGGRSSLAITHLPRSVDCDAYIDRYPMESGMRDDSFLPEWMR